ncbi:MAG: hypothetical protein EXQ85_02735 [Alphaproteobacteria bacterium]|nr:hypothetical protein [Alphaproteobacteria bacterium]
MPVHATHPMFPGADHDEQARQDFIRLFKLSVQRDIGAGNRSLYEAKVKPDFQRRYGRAPKDRREVREAMGQDPYNQMWSALLCTSQEMLYDTVGPSIERQLPDLLKKAKKYSGK